jgi:hypothetical protein
MRRVKSATSLRKQSSEEQEAAKLQAAQTSQALSQQSSLTALQQRSNMPLSVLKPDAHSRGRSWSEIGTEHSLSILPDVSVNELVILNSVNSSLMICDNNRHRILFDHVLAVQPLLNRYFVIIR